MGEEVNNFQELSKEIMTELSESLYSVQNLQAREVMEALLNARKVFVIGVGRVMLMLEAFVKRLNHIGIEAYYVGEINEPACTSKDVLLIASGSGESAIPVAIGRVAKKYHPQIIYVGSNMESTVAKMSDLKLRIPCRTKLKLEDEITSRQPMSSLFEQSLLLTLDTLAFMIIEEKKIMMESLWDKHANLE